MKITKEQLRKMIQEAIAEEKDQEQEYEVKIGKDAGRNKIQSTRVLVMATSRDDAREKAKQHPTFIRGGYQYAMIAAPNSLDDYI